MDLSATTWTATAGSIDNNGLFTAPYASAVVTVTATSSLVSGTAGVTVLNAAPTIATSAAATPATVTGTTTALSVLGADDAGESNLTYTWLATNKPGGAADPTYTDNGTNTAKNTMATFFQAGDYTLEVTITDDGGLSTTSSVDVTVDQTLTSITVTPAGGLSADGTEPFAATALDQFGNALVSQPAFAWSLDGGGAISSGGVFSPPYTDGSATVLATSGSVSGSDTVALPGAALWNSAVNASWNDPNRWTSSVFGSTVTAPGLRGIPGDAAVFDTAADSTVSLNGSSPSLAGITFNGPGSLTVAQGSGGTLHLDNGSASATVTVAGGSSTIAAPVQLDSNLVVSTASGSTLNLSGGVSGTGSRLTFSGQGTLVLSGANTCSGGTTVTGGTLVVTSATALADGGSLTVGAGIGLSASAAASPPSSSSLPASTAAASPVPQFVGWDKVAPTTVGRRKPVNPQFWSNAEITVDRDRRPTSAPVCLSHPTELSTPSISAESQAPQRSVQGAAHRFAVSDDLAQAVAAELSYTARPESVPMDDTKKAVDMILATFGL